MYDSLGLLPQGVWDPLLLSLRQALRNDGIRKSLGFRLWARDAFRLTTTFTYLLLTFDPGRDGIRPRFLTLLAFEHGVWDPLMVEALAKEGCRAILVDGPVLLVAFGLQPLI